MKRKRSETYLCRAIALTGASALLMAQSFTGAITGNVTDPAGAAVPNAKIVAVDQQSNVPTETRSDAQGDYSLPSLRPGIYRLEVEAPGFRRLVVRADIEVRVNDRLLVDLTMTLGAINESVEVTARRPWSRASPAQLRSVLYTRPQPDRSRRRSQ